MITYFGNGSYCYANAVSMLLSSIGENIPPGRIEVLSGVGLGAFWLKDARLIYFGNLVTPPDVGVSKALNLLGFEFKEKWCKNAKPVPLEELRNDLRQSPAVLGPLDLGFLNYVEGYEYGNGSDHFIFAYAMDEHEIYLHDPEGYPHVSLALKQLAPAWKASKIPYHRGFYRYWTAIRRTCRFTEEQINDRALQSFKSAYRESREIARREGWIVGHDAIVTSARQVRHRNGATTLLDHLTCFALRLGAKRALDYASFFNSCHPELAALKAKQAELFGRSYTFAARKNRLSLASTLEELAGLEGTFESTLLGC